MDRYRGFDGAFLDAAVSVEANISSIACRAATYSVFCATPVACRKSGLARLMLFYSAAMARRLASLSPFAFAQTKTQMRQPVVERLERGGAAIDKIAIEIWAAEETLDHVRDYVARTLKKA
jgi:hypothetical protein